MSNLELELMDFLGLRGSVDELERALKPDPQGNFIFPRLTGEVFHEEETIEVGDVLKTTLAAVDSAARELKGNGISLASEPIEINLTGSLVGISPNADRILIKIKPDN